MSICPKRAAVAMKAAAVIAGGALTLLPVTAQAAGNPRRAIQSVYNRISQALSKKDADAVLATRDDDYQEITTDGSVDVDGKEDEEQRLDNVFAHATAIRDKATVLSVTMIGHNAVVTVKADYTRIESDPTRHLVGKLHEVSTDQAFWVNRAGTWLLHRQRDLTLEETTTINGRVVKHTVD